MACTSFGGQGALSAFQVGFQSSTAEPAYTSLAYLLVRALDKSQGPKSVEVQRVWGIYDGRLQFMARDDARVWRVVSRALDVWSSAADAAIADAYRFSGGPVPDRGLVLGRGAFLVRTVRLGGPEVRKARRNFADPLEGGDVLMYHDASTDLLLDLRRWFEAVLNVLRAMIRDGITLARSFELAAQWDGILRIGPVFPHCAGS